MINKIKKMAFLLVCVVVLPCCSTGRNKTPLLDELLTDMKLYKTYSHHCGDLYEHSMWVEQYLSRWCMEQDKQMSWVQQWAKNFTECDKYVLALAGLLHDIGKAGDSDCSKYQSYRRDGNYIFYFSKKGREYLGFTYVLHDIGDAAKFKQGYLKVNGQPLNIKLLFDELRLADQEQRLVAVLIGSHKFFTELLMNPKSVKINENVFIEKVKKLLSESGLATKVNEKILSMVMILGIADLCASYFPVEQPGPSLVFGSFTLCKKVHDFPGDASMIHALRTKFTARAPQLRDEVLAVLLT